MPSEEYIEGEVAAMRGMKIWDNPYCGPFDDFIKFNQWLAGWCNKVRYDPTRSENERNS